MRRVPPLLLGTAVLVLVGVGLVYATAGNSGIGSMLARLACLLWFDAEPAARIVNTLIFGVLAYSLVLVARASAAVKADMAVLDHARAILGERDIEPTSLQDLERSVRLNTAITSESAVVRRWREVWRSVNSVPSATGQSLVVSEEMREEGRSDIPSYFSTVLVLMGLFGTVWGLSDAIGPLGTAIRNMNDPAAGLQSVEEVIASLSTAFSCTIMGVLSTIVLSGLNFFLVTRFQTRFLSSLETFIETEILPRFIPPSAESTLQGLSAATETLAQNLDGIVRRSQDCLLNISQSAEMIARELGDQIAPLTTQIGSIATSLAESGTILSSAIVDFRTEHQSFRRFVEDTVVGLRDQVGYIHQQSLETLTGIGTEHKAFLEQAQQEYERFFSSTDQVCNELGKSAEALQHIAIQLGTKTDDTEEQQRFAEAIRLLSEQSTSIESVGKHMGYLVHLSAETLNYLRDGSHVAHGSGVASRRASSQFLDRSVDR